jgi:hypothetical protein
VAGIDGDVPFTTVELRSLPRAGDTDAIVRRRAPWCDCGVPDRRHTILSEIATAPLSGRAQSSRVPYPLADDAGVGAWSRGLTVGVTRSDVRRLLEHALHDSQHDLDDVERGVTTMSR